jgi:hypothetical protein
MLWQIKNGEMQRRVDTTEEKEYFFNWSVVRNDPLRGGFHSLVSEIYQAVTYLQIRMDYNNEANEVIVWGSERDSEKIQMRTGSEYDQ